MKKSHMILMVITAMTILFSVYSLAAINQVYKINFQWYSQYYKKYTYESRDTGRYKWLLSGYPKSMKFNVMEEYYDHQGRKIPDVDMKFSILRYNTSKYVTLHCTLGYVNSPEYRIKVTDIAQRGGVIEVKVSLNSPVKTKNNSTKQINDNIQNIYNPSDIVRIDKSILPVKGMIYFVFKNQQGNQISEKYYFIR